MPTTKRIITLAIALLVSVLPALSLATTTASASVSGKPLQMVTALYNDLNLTPEQVEQIKAVLKSHEDDIAALLTAEAATRSVLIDAVQQPVVDESAVRQAAAAVGVADTQLNVERAEIYSEIYPILTEQQRSTLAQFFATVENQVLTRERNAAYPQKQLNSMFLTPQQKDQIKAILQAHKSDIDAIITQEKTARAALLAAIQQPELNVMAVRQASAAVVALDADLAVERAEIYSEVYAVLTPEQIATLEAYLARLEAQIQGRLEVLAELFAQLL